VPQPDQSFRPAGGCDRFDIASADNMAGDVDGNSGPPGVAETVLSMRNKLPRFMDFPAESGGSGQQLSE